MSKYQKAWLLVCQVWALQDCGRTESEIIEQCFKELDEFLPVRKGRTFDSRERELMIRFHGTVGNYFMQIRRLLPPSLLNQFRLGMLNSRSKDRVINITRSVIAQLADAKRRGEDEYRNVLKQLEEGKL